MRFKDTSELSLEISTLLEEINSLPKVNCSQCGTAYRGEEENFICTSCKEEEQERVEEEMKRNYQIQRLFNLSNIPKRYKRAIFQPKTEIQKRVAQYFIKNFTQKGLFGAKASDSEKKLDKSTDILLFGAIGTGKTYISCAFALELIKKNQKSVKFITEYDLLGLYFEKNYNAFKSFKECEILILDEIGKRVLAEWQRVQLEELLSHRYNEMLPTIYITNLEQNDFRDFLGSRLTDRLRENGLKRFAFDGESLRD